MSPDTSFQTDVQRDVVSRDLTCVVCPNGCRLHVEGGGAADALVVTGNRCGRGKDFALAEVTNPMRTISSTVATAFPDAPVVPVRVSAEIPKARISDVMSVINGVRLCERVGMGIPVVRNVCGLGVDVIVTSDVLLEGGRMGSSVRDGRGQTDTRQRSASS